MYRRATADEIMKTAGIISQTTVLQTKEDLERERVPLIAPREHNEFKGNRLPRAFTHFLADRSTMAERDPCVSRPLGGA